MSIAEERWEPEIDFGTRLRLVRREFGRRTQRLITQETMAEMLSVTKGAYIQWEAGNNLPRDVVSIAKHIEEVTGVQAVWLLGLAGTGYYRTDADKAARSERELVAA